MANEAVCIETPTRFARRTISPGAVLPFGTLTVLSDPNTVAATSSNSDKFGGIVWTPSISTDAFTEITVALDGTWDLKDSGSGFTVGELVSVGGANTVKTCTEAELITGDTVGKADETASASEVSRVQVGVTI